MNFFSYIARVLDLLHISSQIAIFLSLDTNGDEGRLGGILDDLLGPNS